MFTRGYAKHPCTQIKYSQRVAVRPIRPYPRCRIGLQGGPLYTGIDEFTSELISKTDHNNHVHHKQIFCSTLPVVITSVFHFSRFVTSKEFMSVACSSK